MINKVSTTGIHEHKKGENASLILEPCGPVFSFT
jgi:hypothetical protein